MSAEERFKKLGYENYIPYRDKIVYRNIHKTKNDVYISSIKQEHNNGALPKEIIFWKDLQCIDFEYGRLGSYLYLELLKAIQQQCKELGWLDEE